MDGTKLFLTAKSSGEGSQVYWDDESTNTNQYWTLMTALIIDLGTTATIYSVKDNQFTGKLSTTEMTANAKYIYWFLTRRGLSRAVACALLGNFQLESSLNPNMREVIDDVCSGYGIAQWTPQKGEVRNPFIKWAYEVGVIKEETATAVNNLSSSKPQYLMDYELLYLMYNIEIYGYGFSPAAWNTFKATTGRDNVCSLTEKFFTSYERPNPGDTSLPTRKEYAIAWFDNSDL